MSARQRLWERIATIGDGKYQVIPSDAVLGPIISVQRDSNNEIVSATGPLNGVGEFTVNMKGHHASPRDILKVTYPGNEPVGAELTYVRHISSINPGSTITDANFPIPTFVASPVTSVIRNIPGSILATATVSFNAVEEKWRPSEYTVSWRVNSGQWQDQKVPHIGGIQQCSLGSDFAPGSSIDLHLRAYYYWANAWSLASADYSTTLAADTASAGGVISISVNVTVPNQAVVTPSATLDLTLFQGYQYEYNTASTGTAIAITGPIPGPWTAVLPPGTYYFAARTVSKSGVLGARIPVSGFQGPYVIFDQSANLDLTAPGAIAAPTLTSFLLQNADNAWHGFLTITRPAYTEPSDFAATEYSIVCNDGRIFYAETPSGVTVLTIEVGFGTFTVALRGRDRAGNRPVFGSTAVTTITKPALSNTAPTATTATVGAGVKVAWNRITGALAYEVQRASSASPGSGTSYLTEVGADSPLLWMQGNEASGSTAFDSGTRSISGTYIGSPSIHQQAQQGLYSTEFDGVNDAISIPDAADLDITGNLTLEALVYPTSYADVRMLITKLTLPTGPYQWYLTLTSGLPYFSDTNGSLAGTAAPPLNQWSHIAVTRSGRVVTHYLNGVANGTATIAGAAPVASADPVYIGRRSEAAPTYHFLGRIAQPAIYTTVLSLARIAAHSAAITNPPGVTIATTDALWFFDSLTEDTIILPTYWYRVRPISVQDGAIIQGTWSTWTAGTVGAVDAQNLRLQSVTAAVIAANAITANKIAAGAVTAAKLEADLILSGDIRTALTGTRWEIRGNGVAAPANVIRMLEAISGTDYERVRLQGTGLTVYGDAAQSDISISRSATGRGQLLAHGVTIGHNGTYPFINVDLNSSAKFQLTGPSSTLYFEQGAFGAANSVVARSTDGTIGDPIMTFYHNVGGGSGLEKLGLSWSGIASAKSGDAGYGTEFKRSPTTADGWASNVPIKATQLIAGAVPSYFASWVQTAVLPGTLANAGASEVYGVGYQYLSANRVSLRLTGYRGQTITSSDWQDARYRFTTEVDNFSAHGGGLQLGFRGYSTFVGFYDASTALLFWDAAANKWDTNGKNFHVGGTLSKTAGSFVIPDPTPGHERDELRHCFVEGPTRGENLYTYVVRFGPRGGGFLVEDSEGKTVEDTKIIKHTNDHWLITIPLPDYWPHLNERPRCIPTNSGDGWGRVKARVNDTLDTLTVEAEEGGEYTVLLIGTRKDDAAKNWWDRRGVRKTEKQQWDNENTLQRRANILEIRSKMKESQGKVVRPLLPLHQHGPLVRPMPNASTTPGNV